MAPEVHVPDIYKCCDCNATNCKLWRAYQSLSAVKLRCAECAAKIENKSIDGIDSDGCRPSDMPDMPGDRTNTIGFHIPAITTADNVRYYSFAEGVAEDRMNWWKALPTLPERAAA